MAYDLPPDKNALKRTLLQHVRKVLAHEGAPVVENLALSQANQTAPEGPVPTRAVFFEPGVTVPNPGLINTEVQAMLINPPGDDNTALQVFVAVPDAEAQKLRQAGLLRQQPSGVQEGVGAENITSVTGILAELQRKAGIGPRNEGEIVAGALTNSPSPTAVGITRMHQDTLGKHGNEPYDTTARFVLNFHKDDRTKLLSAAQDMLTELGREASR